MPFRIRSAAPIWLLLLLTLSTTVVARHQQTAPELYLTQRISDPNQSQGPLGENKDIIGSSGGESVHLTWEEALFDGSYGTFYRQLPNGSTSQIPDLVPNQWGQIRLAHYLAPDGSLYLLYLQETANMTTDLYLWRPGWSHSERLSGTNFAGGNAYLPSEILFDSQGQAQIVWVEGSIKSFNQNLFLWRENSGVTTVISDTSYLNGVIQRYGFALAADEVHISWAEYNGSAFLAYNWDTGTVQTRLLSPPDWRNTAGPIAVVTDGNEIPHTFWAEQDSHDNACPFHWTPLLAEAENLAPHDSACDLGDFNAMYADRLPTGAVQFLWESNALGNTDDISVYVWHSDTGSTATYDIALPYAEIEPLVAADGSTYLVWDDHEDVFYWHSPEAISHKISPPGDDLVIFEPAALVSNDSNLHVLWYEGNKDLNIDVWYFNPTLPEAISVLDPSVVGGTLGPTSYPFRHLDAQNALHLFWQDTSAINNSENYYHWDSTSQLVELFFADVSNMMNSRMLWTASDQHYVLWQQPMAAEGTDMFLWSSLTGILDLSDHSLTAGNVSHQSANFVFMSDKSENIFVVWAEETDTPAGDDVFAYYNLPFDHQSFLPLIQRQMP